MAPGPEPYYAGVGGGPVPTPNAGAPGTGPGPIQPTLLHQLGPHPEAYVVNPYYQPFRNHNINLHEHQARFGATSSSHANTSSNPPHQQQQAPAQPPQTQPQQQQSALTASRSTAARPVSTAASRGISLPALNPPPPIPASLPQPTMSSNNSGDSSPEAPPTSRGTSFFPSLHDASISGRTRGAGNSNGNASTFSAVPPPRPLFFGGAGPSGPEGALSDPDTMSASQAPAAPSNITRRRSHSSRVRPGRPPVSDYDSDDEIGDYGETDALTFLEQLAGNPALRGVAEAEEIRIRAHQVLQGQMSNKRVASKRALSQLQSVDLSSLEESERSKCSTLITSTPSRPLPAC